MTKALIRLFIKNAEDTRSAAVREQYGILSGAVGLACNLFLFALKLTIGLVTGAISIAADAFNNLSDGLSCMISIVGFKVSNREPDEKHPFGVHRRPDRFVHHPAGRLRILQNVARPHHSSVRRRVFRASDRYSGGLHARQAVDGAVQHHARPPHRLAGTHRGRSGQPQRCDHDLGRCTRHGRGPFHPAAG